MDHLVLHTPENQLPASLREKKEQTQQAQARGGAVQLPKNQNAFLAPPTVVLPGWKYRCISICGSYAENMGQFGGYVGLFGGYMGRGVGRELYVGVAVTRDVCRNGILYTYIYIHMYIYIYVCTYLYVHVFMYIYI